MTKRESSREIEGGFALGKHALLSKKVPHKPALLFFFFLLAYNFIIMLRCVPPSIGVYYVYYVLNFSFGFCTRLLPGTVYNLFVSEPSPQSATAYMYILMILFLAAVSLLLEKLLLSLPSGQQPLCLLLVAFYLTGPATFSPHIFAFGLLDVHWLIAMIPFLLLLQNKWGRFLLPVFPFVLMLISFGAIISWVPFCGLLVFYELTLTEVKKHRRQIAAIFFVTIMVAVGTFAYFSANEKKNLNYSIDEFNQILVDHGCYYLHYFDSSFYGDFAAAIKVYTDEFGDENNPYASYEDYKTADFKDYFSNMADGKVKQFLNTLFNRFGQHWLLYRYQDYAQLKKSLGFMLMLLIVLAPPGCLFYAVLRRKWQIVKGDRLNRFLYFCLQVFFPILIIVSLFISIDSTRWTMHSFMMLFTFILYMIYKEKGSVLDILREKLCAVPRLALLIYGGIYSFTFISPYVYA